MARRILGNSDQTTPYPNANYAFTPGYYQDSLAACPNEALKEDETLTIKCKRNGANISCIENLSQKDIAVIQCKQGYNYPNMNNQPQTIECLAGGKWSQPIFACVPNCGRVTKKAAALIVRGSDTDVLEFPWNVAVYRGDLLICGGSIISERVILSAGEKI